MKKIEQVKEIFDIFPNTSSERFKKYLKGENWKIFVFKPFTRDNRIHYPFRIYGKVSGSKFSNYNKQLQWYGGVNYYLDLDTKELIREEYKNELHEAILLHVNLSDLQKIL